MSTRTHRTRSFVCQSTYMSLKCESQSVSLSLASFCSMRLHIVAATNVNVVSVDETGCKLNVTCSLFALCFQKSSRLAPKKTFGMRLILDGGS